MPVVWRARRCAVLRSRGRQIVSLDARTRPVAGGNRWRRGVCGPRSRTITRTRIATNPTNAQVMGGKNLFIVNTPGDRCHQIKVHFLVNALAVPRRFPPPWLVEESDACFVVRDHSGQALAYVYFEEELGRRSAVKLLTKDEARRMR